MNEKQQVIGRFSVEILTHFNCGRCHNWWSVGDPPPQKRDWFCPWCGQQQLVDPDGEPHLGTQEGA